MLLSSTAVPRVLTSNEMGRFIALLICVAGFPLHLCICGLIWLLDSRPALFRSRRLGRGGTSFEILKYRSMRVGNAPVLIGGQKLVVAKDDPRVTPIGRFLRLGLDEMPQLWNVVRGEMTWIGPRPDEARILPQYGPTVRERISVAPGITGIAQVLNSRNLPIAQSYAIDVWYIRHRSFWIDAWVVLVTPLFMLGWRALGRSRYERLRGTNEFGSILVQCKGEMNNTAPVPIQNDRPGEVPA